MNHYYSAQQAKVCIVCGSSKRILVARTSGTHLTRQYTKLVADFSCSDDIELFKCLECDLLYFTPQLIANAAFYRELSKFDWYYLKEKPEYEIVSKILSRGGSVLEVGAGDANFRKYLNHDCFYVGSELEPSDVQRSKGVVSVDELPQFTKFDNVISFQVIEHVDAPGLMVREMWDKVEVGGNLVIVVPSWNSFLNFAHESTLNMPPHHLSLWTDAALNNLASQLDSVKSYEVLHENVASFHRNWFLAERIFLLIRKIARIKNDLIYKEGFLDRIWILSIRISRMAVLPLPIGQKRGHSVILVVKKSLP
jgi:SAM-dependent methyltransferase